MDLLHVFLAEVYHLLFFSDEPAVGGADVHHLLSGVADVGLN